MAHNFKDFPELTNSQMQIYYFESPHKQITENFRATVVKVHDGDTITLRWTERDFDFPLRFMNTNAPELKEDGGKESQMWLESQLLNEEVDIIINQKQRVEKWGRLLGTVVSKGINMSEESIRMGHAKPFGQRLEGKIPDINKTMDIKRWL